MKNSWVAWNYDEAGAASIDCKRPYGNGDVSRDIYRLIYEEEMPEDEDGDSLLEPRELERIWDLHEDTQKVLQILLDNADIGIKPGVYKKDGFSIPWRISYAPADGVGLESSKLDE